MKPYGIPISSGWLLVLARFWHVLRRAGCGGFVSRHLLARAGCSGLRQGSVARRCRPGFHRARASASGRRTPAARLVAVARPTTANADSAKFHRRRVTGGPARWLRITAWSDAGDHAPIRELQAELVGPVSEHAAVRRLRVEPGPPGLMSAVTKISNPLLYADMPVIAIAACSDRSNRRVLKGRSRTQRARALPSTAAAIRAVTCDRGWQVPCFVGGLGGVRRRSLRGHRLDGAQWHPSLPAGGVADPCPAAQVVSVD